MIAYYFPPMGGAGVQRTLKFVKYLPEYKWQPYILTVQPPKILRDQSLLDEVPQNLPTIRTPYLHMLTSLPWRLRNFVARWFLVIDEQIGWLPYAISAGLKVIKSNEIKLIYSTSAPYTTHLVARRLHHQSHIPWVADFRDPWMNNPFISFPTAIHRRINEYMERSVFTEADRVILNTDISRQYHQEKYSNLPADKFITITNGYDQEDFPGYDNRVKTRSIFTIVHLGSLYQKSRSSKFFLEALHKVFQTGMLQTDKIRLLFVGNIDKKTPEYIDQFGLGGTVELLGYIPHRQAISYLFDADLLLLIPNSGSGAELFVPAKLYEYLASRKPIICLADSGACSELIIQARAGSVIPPTDISKISEKIVLLYQQWEQDALKIDPDLDLIASFERRNLTRTLASLFDELV